MVAIIIMYSGVAISWIHIDFLLRYWLPIVYKYYKFINFILSSYNLFYKHFKSNIRAKVSEHRTNCCQSRLSISKCISKNYLCKFRDEIMSVGELSCSYNLFKGNIFSSMADVIAYWNAEQHRFLRDQTYVTSEPF